MNYETKTLELSAITLDPDTQPRIKQNKKIAKQYMELLISGETTFPPVVVFQEGNTYYLADGWHRFCAHLDTFKKQISCHIYQGTKREATLYSVGANGKHGLHMKSADKRRAVTKLLEDQEWSKWSNSKIASTCHVTPSFVSNLRKSLSTVDSEISQERTYTNKHGSVTVMNTANIGKRSIQEPSSGSSAPKNLCSKECKSTIAELNKQLAAYIQELELKDELIADLENQLAKFRKDEFLPF